MQTNPAVEQNKTLNGPLVREISPVGKEVYGGNDLVKSQDGIQGYMSTLQYVIGLLSHAIFIVTKLFCCPFLERAYLILLGTFAFRHTPKSTPIFNFNTLY